MKDLQDVELGDEAILSRPVMVYGPRKAGTTLLQGMLDGGAGLLMVPGELKLKYVFFKRWLEGRSVGRWFVERGRSFFAEVFEVSADGERVLVKAGCGMGGLTAEEVGEVVDLERYAEGLTGILRGGSEDLGEVIRADLRAFVGALRVRPGAGVRWGSKEVGGDSGRILGLFREIFPEGRVVYAVRQPEFIVRSILLNRRRSRRRMSVRAVLHELRDAQDVVNHGYEQVLGKQGVVVAYERLTEDPKGVIEGVCRELGLPCGEVNGGPTTFGREVVVTTSSRKTTRVFRQEEDWRKGLTALDVLLVRVFQVCGPVFYRMRGRRMVRYGELMRAMERGEG